MSQFVQVLISSALCVLTGWLTRNVFWLIYSKPCTLNIVFINPLLNIQNKITLAKVCHNPFCCHSEFWCTLRNESPSRKVSLF